MENAWTFITWPENAENFSLVLPFFFLFVVSVFLFWPAALAAGIYI